ncbi:hypothetical protein J5226_19675 [Lysobacter sp. K5869]|uniref:J domain-containing protein n=1 Tax=Lysobacter sp. K5869 TaxID=2820808 RepID=UPI001C05FE70|nr:J domain-containing protein [Lysobacter sp. K5869]QWP75806.1 hypothetical protein J5226_19675 [Lysobacter sp. K5869]
MSAFARLGLAPTRDEREIKRAYARELKRCRPDEDPQGFQALNEAYAECLRLAQGAGSDEALKVQISREQPPLAESEAASGDVSGRTDADIAAFLHDFDLAAERHPTRDLLRWLEQTPPLQSLAHRREIAAALPEHLRRRRPSLYLQQLKGVLAWFGFAPSFDPDDEPRAWVHALYAAARERGLELELDEEEEERPPLPWRERWRRDWRDMIGTYVAWGVIGAMGLGLLLAGLARYLRGDL